MVSQFVSSHNVTLLGDLNYTFPEGIHAIGRLDNWSEGLLLLTTDKSITRRLYSDIIPHSRTYLVQVRKKVDETALKKLQSGITIIIKGGKEYTTANCNVSIVTNPEDYISYVHPDKEYEPTSWLLMTLYEGKFHQVRKMVDAAGHRCKRLIRVSIENLNLGKMQPGEVQPIQKDDFYRLLKLHKDRC